MKLDVVSIIGKGFNTLKRFLGFSEHPHAGHIQEKVRDRIRHIYHEPLEQTQNMPPQCLEALEKKRQTMTKELENMSVRFSQGRMKPNLSSIAQERMQLLKQQVLREGKSFGHDMDWLSNNGCAENILKGRFRDSKDIMKAFLRSQKGHRENVLGSYTDVGVHVEYIPEKGEYYVVMLYKNGEPKAKEPVPERERDDPEIIALHGIETKTQNMEPLKGAFEELTNQAETRGLSVKVSDRKEVYKVTFRNKNGKFVQYLCTEVPPLFHRKQDGKKVSIPFHAILKDVETALI